MFRVWTAGNSADGAVQYLRARTILGSQSVVPATAYPAHSRKFRHNSHLLRRILSLDRPPIIVTYNRQGHEVPAFCFMYGQHVPMGQNAFQSLPQLVGAAEAGFPVVWVRPVAGVVWRKDGSSSVETAPKLLWHVLEQIGNINSVPTILLPWPTTQGQPNSSLAMDPDWPRLPDTNGRPSIASIVNALTIAAVENWSKSRILEELSIREALLQMDIAAPAVPEPLSKDSGVMLEPRQLAPYLMDCGLDDASAGKPERELAPDLGYMVLVTNTRQIRADPYAGTACAYDYAFCRTGPTSKERDRALVIQFRQVSFEEGWKRFFASKPNKDTRLFLSLADVLVFSDGLFYRTQSGWKVSTEQFPETYLVAAPQDYSLGQ